MSSSHVSPVNPASQLHVNLLISSTHVPVQELETQITYMGHFKGRIINVSQLGRIVHLF